MRHPGGRRPRDCRDRARAFDLHGLARDATGTPYAALGTQPRLASRFGVRIAGSWWAPTMCSWSSVQARLLSQLRWPAGRARRACSRAGRARRHDTRAGTGRRRIRGWADRRGHRWAVATVGGELGSTNPSQVPWSRARTFQALTISTPRRGARRWCSRSLALTADMGKSPRPNLVCCRGWPAARPCLRQANPPPGGVSLSAPRWRASLRRGGVSLSRRGGVSLSAPRWREPLAQGGENLCSKGAPRAGESLP